MNKRDITIVKIGFAPKQAEKINKDMQEFDKLMECPICKKRKADEGHYVIGHYEEGNVPIHTWVCDDCYNKYFTIKNLDVEVIL